MSTARASALSLILPLALGAADAAAQGPAPGWREACDGGGGRGEMHCEVREFAFPATGLLSVDAGPNGGVRVEGWDGDQVQVVARVNAHAATAEEARELARSIVVTADEGRVRATGPRDGSRRRGWSVSFHALVPRRSDLRLETSNGGLSVRDVEGRLDLETTNGGISLENVAGDVRGETTNGGLSVRLAGPGWTGVGLDLETTNGGVDLVVPDGYSARLVARTVQGRVTTELPLTVRGELGRRVEADLGSGGAPLRVSTTNGGVRVRRAE